MQNKNSSEIRKVKCSECKYLRRIPKNSKRFQNISSKAIAIQQSITNLYECKANISRIFREEKINELRECQLYRSRTKTAWEEVKGRCWKKFKDIANPQNWISVIISVIRRIIGM